MKNLVFTALFGLFLVSCGHHSDINKVKKGMSDKEVVAIMGEPDKKQPMMMGITWWRYGDNQMVILTDDTVVNVVPDVKEMGRQMENAMKELDKETK
jgi:hypothetical protein